MTQHDSNNKWPRPLFISQSSIIRLSVLGELVITLHILIYHTKKMFRLRMFSQMHSCMNLVDFIYERSNASQKNAVHELYIAFLHDLRSSCTEAEWNLFIAMMPESLYKAYLNC